VKDEDKERKRKAAEDLAWHDREMAKGAAEASRDVLHDNTPGKERGEYTKREAIDRAAHTPGWHEQSGGKAAFTEEERKLLAQSERDLAELYPTDEAWAQSYPAVKPPADAEQRQQYFDERELYASAQAEKTKEGGLTNVTPEQKVNVDKSLNETSLSTQIGTASDVSQAKPNDPTPIEKARDIGQDLNKAGVTMDKD
jgi:hypothetical protein